MTDFMRQAAEKLGFRQKTYQTAFVGSAMQLVLVDLAQYAQAFDADLPDATPRMQGRRDVFFRIFNHLKLSPFELEQVYGPAVAQTAARLQRQQGASDD